MSRASAKGYSEFENEEDNGVSDHMETNNGTNGSPRRTGSVQMTEVKRSGRVPPCSKADKG